MSKNCKRCGELKELQEFYRHPQMPDGHLNFCKECKRVEARANREKKAEYYREYDRKRGFRNYDPVKTKARQAVKVALGQGRLTKKPCHCGSTAVEAHHPDYSKPLDVVWMCRPHHAEVHRH